MSFKSPVPILSRAIWSAVMIISSISSGDFSAPQSATSWRTRASKGGSIDDWRRDGWSCVAPAVKSSTAKFRPSARTVHAKIPLLHQIGENLADVTDRERVMAGAFDQME